MYYLIYKYLEISGKKLKTALKRADITQQEAAEKLQVSRQTVVSWSSKAKLDDDIIEKVKSKLNIDLKLGEEVEEAQAPEMSKTLNTFMAYLKRHNKSVSAVANEMNVSRNTIYYQLNRETGPDAEFSAKFFDATGETLETVLKFGGGDLVRGVPYYESDITGSIVGSFSDVKESPAFFVDFKPFNDCQAYFTLHGDSMYPKYQSGEILAVKQWNNPNTLLWGEAYLVITDASENDLRTVKTVHPHEKRDDAIILRATNPNFKGDTVIAKKAIKGLYIVKGKIRKDQI